VNARTNAEWLRALKSAGDDQIAALTDLRAYLVRAATFALQRRGRVGAEHLTQLAEDCAQEALVAVLAHLDDFRGESRFTTWAYVFAINRALVAARRERWRNVSLDALLETSSPTVADAAADDTPAEHPERRVMRQELVATLSKAIDECLSERQRQAIRAVVLHSVPLDEVVRHWQSNRNAVYKLLHDARRKLRECLEARGYSAAEVRAVLDDPR